MLWKNSIHVRGKNFSGSRKGLLLTVALNLRQLHCHVQKGGLRVDVASVGICRMVWAPLPSAWGPGGSWTLYLGLCDLWAARPAWAPLKAGVAGSDDCILPHVYCVK